jgi:hypothetical protein
VAACTAHPCPVEVVGIGVRRSLLLQDGGVSCSWPQQQGQIRCCMLLGTLSHAVAGKQGLGTPPSYHNLIPLCRAPPLNGVSALDARRFDHHSGCC